MNARMRYACTALQHLDSEIKLFAVAEREHAANDVVREAAALQKARAARLLFVAGGSIAVLAREDRARALFFAGSGNALDDRIADAMHFQVLADLRRTVLARELIPARFGIALVGKVLARFEIVQHGLERGS